MEQDKIGKELTKEDIESTLNELEGIDVDVVGGTIDGEYKEHSFEIDEENNVIVGKKIKGEKPNGIAQIITKEEGVEKVQIHVEGGLEGGYITSIEPISEGVELKEDKGSNLKIYEVVDNGEYIFRIKGNNNRSIKVSCNVTNAVPSRKDLIDAIARIDKNGVQKVKVKGKTSENADEEAEIYSLNVIIVNEDLILDGTEKNIDGLSLSENTYSVGSKDDVGSNSSRRSRIC